MAARKNVTEEAGTLGALLRLPYLALSRRVYGGLIEERFPDVRPAHSAVFRNVSPDGSRVTDLAERAQMTKQSMAYLVEYLERQGYVSLEPDPTDGRAKRVCLTERGQAFVDAALEASREAESELAAAMGADAVADLRRLLAEANAALGR